MNSGSVNLLRSVLKGPAYLPGDVGYEEMRATWDLAVEHRPALIVAPEEPADVIAAVRFARKHELPVAVQGAGHGPIFGCNGGVLINNRRMKKISIDRADRVARVEAGVVWGELLNAAHEFGLAGLSGTAPDVGVVGYTLGGGTGWLARQYGYASDSVTAVEIVTGDGRLLRATEHEYSDLFWAVRGGGGSFGVVTALEFRLYPVSMVYGGTLYFPVERAHEVFRTYVEWTRELPESVTSTIVIVHVPDAPFVPEPARGKSFVEVQGCMNMPAAEATELLKPLRALAPVMDDFAWMAYKDSGRIAHEPEHPMWARTGTESLAGLPEELVDDLLMEAGDRAHTSLALIAFRHIEGAYRREGEDASAASRPDARFVMLSIGTAMTPEQRDLVAADTAALRGVCRPYRAGSPLFNFVGWGGRDRAEIGELYSDAKYRVLTGIKERYDPDNLFRFAMPVALPELAAA
jgi:FAD/FMN-containing dehydrogenase